MNVIVYAEIFIFQNSLIHIEITIAQKIVFCIANINILDMSLLTSYGQYQWLIIAYPIIFQDHQLDSFLEILWWEPFCVFAVRVDSQFYRDGSGRYRASGSSDHRVQVIVKNRHFVILKYRYLFVSLILKKFMMLSVPLDSRIIIYFLSCLFIYCTSN